MRNFLMMMVIILAGILAACGSLDDTSGSDVSGEEAAASEQKDVTNADAEEAEEPTVEEIATEEEMTQEDEISEPEKDENGNYVLNTVGQTITTEGMGTVELMKIAEINEVVSIEPIDVTIKDIKLFKMTDLHPDTLDMMTMYGLANTEVEELNYVQINYTSENTSDLDVDWYGFNKVVLSNGQQLDASMNDFITDDSDMDSIFYGKVKKEGTVGLLYKGNPEEITTVKLILFYTMDAESYEDISPEQQVEYNL